MRLRMTRQNRDSGGISGIYTDIALMAAGFAALVSGAISGGVDALHQFIPEMIQPSHTIVEAREIASEAGAHIVDLRQFLHEACFLSTVLLLAHRARAAARKARRVSRPLAAAILVSAVACMAVPFLAGYALPILGAALGGAVACDVLLDCRRTGSMSKLQMGQVTLAGMSCAALPADLAAGPGALHISLGLALAGAVLTDPFKGAGDHLARLCRRVRRAVCGPVSRAGSSIRREPRVDIPARIASL
ncbi:MAG: hypothetical protein MPJ06_08655 [Nitrosopumilus sp.]|nr:hypothetical protein [Nitrosopumilus sp.]MDA7944050.1 hypothetical protein [Nitrosopumilus sp.]MDA7999423.1 hypothetical protein [Nitrosopumilus sp.]